MTTTALKFLLLMLAISAGTMFDEGVTPTPTPAAVPSKSVLVERHVAPGSTEVVVPARPSANVATPVSDVTVPSGDKAKIELTKRDGRPIPSRAPYGVTISFSVKNKQSSYGSVVDADGNRKAAVVWAVDIEPSWLRDWIEVVDDGASILVPSGDSTNGAKQVRVTVAGALNNTIAMQEMLVKLGPESPAPNPGPAPTPDPTPPTPPGPPGPSRPDLSSNALRVYDLILASVELTPARKLVCAQLGDNFSDVANEIAQAAAGIPGKEKFKEPAYIEAETFRRNKAAQGDDTKAWEQLFREAMRTWLTDLDKAGTLKTSGDYQSLWPELGRGFKAAAK